MYKYLLIFSAKTCDLMGLQNWALNAQQVKTTFRHKNEKTQKQSATNLKLKLAFPWTAKVSLCH